MSRIPLKYHTNVLFYRKYTHPTLICRGTDAGTDGWTHGRMDGQKIFTQYSGISSCSQGSTYTAIAKYTCLDIKNFYLMTALEYFSYMKMPLTQFTAWIVEQYNLNKHALNGFVHLKMRKAVWGLPQMGILANQRLHQKLTPFRYYESTHSSGLWCHETRPITFTLVVNDSRVKYIIQDNVKHLIASIKQNHSLTKDCGGYLYCRIGLNWDSENCTLDISMPSYIEKKYRNMGTSCPSWHRLVLTHQNQSNLALKPKPSPPGRFPEAGC